MPNLVPRLHANFWRDKDEWLGPAKILNITEHNVILAYNGHQMSSPTSRVRQILPDTTINPDSEDDTMVPPFSTATKAVSRTIEPTPPSPIPQRPRWNQEGRSLQANANCIADSLLVPESLNIFNLPSLSHMGYTYNEIASPRRLERLTAKQATNDANNHLLAQPSLIVEEKTAAIASERDAWKYNKAFVPYVNKRTVDAWKLESNNETIATKPNTNCKHTHPA